MRKRNGKPVFWGPALSHRYSYLKSSVPDLNVEKCILIYRDEMSELSLCGELVYKFSARLHIQSGCDGRKWRKRWLSKGGRAALP